MVQVGAQVKTEEITIGHQAHQGKVLVVEQALLLLLAVQVAVAVLLPLELMAVTMKFAALAVMV